jgi:hypothetical protein
MTLSKTAQNVFSSQARLTHSTPYLCISFDINFNIILQSTPMSINYLVSSVFTIKDLYTLLFFLIHATCFAHLIVNNFIILIKFGEEQTISPSLFNYLQSPLTLPHFVQISSTSPSRIHQPMSLP